MKYLRDILITVLIAVVIFFLLQTTVGAFKVYGTSMLPNLYPGDYVLVNKVSYFFHSPSRGEVIVLQSPQEQNTDLIKRIICLPGDTIEIRDSQVFVNDKPINEPYIKEAPRYKYPKQTIPEGYYFVLGDNRNVSADSHSGWMLPRKDIVGKAWVIYWPPQRMKIIQQYNF